MLQVATYGISQDEIITTKDKKSRARQLAALADHDIVLTTYSILEADGALPMIHWKRIALDEMQEVPTLPLHLLTVLALYQVRSSTTLVAVKCERMPASYRWMISGTPLFTGIDDLNGELHFLVSPAEPRVLIARALTCGDSGCVAV